MKLDDETWNERYYALFDAIVSKEEAEYETEFGPEYRAKHPFVADTRRIHEEVCKLLEK